MEPKSSPTTPNQNQSPTLGTSAVPVATATNVADAAPDNMANSTPDASAPANTTPAAVKPASVTAAVPVKPKSKPFYLQWQLYVMVVLAVVAGVGWYSGATNAKEAETARAKVVELENEIVEKNQLIVKYGTELGYKVGQNGRPVQEGGSGSEAQTAVGEVYIAEWGLKFKIPSQLKNVAYLFDNLELGSDETERITEVCVTGTPNEAIGWPAFADFRRTGGGALGCLVRFPIRTDAEAVDDEGYQIQRSAAVYEDEKYYYIFSSLQAAYSTDPTEQQWELKAVQLVREMLTKNISVWKVS